MRKSTAQVVIIAVMGLGASANAAALDEPGKRCSNATLRGAYGIQMQGTRPSAPGGSIETVIGVVIRHYDGVGGVTQGDNIKARCGYVPDARPAPIRSTRIIGRHRFQPARHYIQERAVIVDNGHEVRSITVLPPPVMVTSVQIRI
jgi:hypothetical protein